MLYISDIQIKEIIFFDKDYSKECFDFCNKRDIDFLPSPDDSNKIWRKGANAHDFKLIVIPDAAKINGNKKAFDREVVEAFKENNLLFVYEGNELTGVVHFSDYNTHVVNVYLFGIFSQYEKMLKEYLRRHGVTNKAIIDSSCNKQYGSKMFQEKINKSQELQCFYLKDVIRFANDNKKANIRLNYDDVIDLRNMVMHAHELVDKKNLDDDNLIFDFTSFQKFFDRVIKINQDFLKLKNRISLF